jgi:hypothetical protein
MKLTKEEIAEIKRVRGQIKVLNGIIEEMGQNLNDTLFLDENDAVKEYLWDCLYGNSTVESFVKFYNKELKIYEKYQIPT